MFVKENIFNTISETLKHRWKRKLNFAEATELIESAGGETPQ